MDTETTEGAPDKPPTHRVNAALGKHHVDDATLLAELERMPAAPAKAAPAPKVEEPAVEAEAPAETLAPGEPTDDELDNPPQPKPDADPDETPAASEPVALDPAAEKRLAASARAERQFKERMAQERAAWDRERQAREREWAPKVEAAERFERLRSRARYAPDAVLEELGFTADDWEPAARAIYARSPAAQKDPAHRAAAERSARERESADKLSATEKRLADLEAKLEGQAREAQTRAQVNAYIGTVAKAATAEAAPLVKNMLTNDPDDARRQLHQVALNLLDESEGEAPAPAAVVAELEKRQRAHLKRLGIDPDAALGKKAAAPAAKPPSRTLGQVGGGATAAREKPASRDDLFKGLLSDLEANRLDS